MLRRCVWVVLCCAASLTLSGCGASPAPGNPQNPTRASAANLNGNWLLSGTIPQGPLLSSSGTSLSVTFTATGDQLVGAGYLTAFCRTGNTGSGFGESFVVSGAINQDGTFSVQTPSSPLLALGSIVTINGSVPSAPDQAWTGQYTLAVPQTQSCPPAPNGNFAATNLGVVNGTFAGNGTIGLGTNATPVSVSLALQQGSASSGVTAQQESLLSGSIVINGHPCFHSGTVVPRSTTNPLLPGNVEGDTLQASFKMDDGSTLILLGYINDPAATQVKVQSAVVPAGPCATTSATSLQLGTLTRQS